MNEPFEPVVLVNGAGSALGRQICAVFAAQGMLVAANDLSPQNLEQTMTAIRSAGAQGRDYVFDSAKKMPVQALVSQVVEEWGRLDFLVNAGIVQPVVPLLEMDEWDWQRTLEVNLGGPFFAIQVAGRVMRHQGGGAIVNLVMPSQSLAGYTGRCALAASQAGLESLTRSAAMELGPHGVRVNAVTVPLLPEQAKPESPSSARPGRVVHRPLDDPYALEAVARQALFLCSPKAAQINGRVFSLQSGEWR